MMVLIWVMLWGATCPVSTTLATECGIDLGDVVGCDMPNQHDISY